MKPNRRDTYLPGPLDLPPQKGIVLRPTSACCLSGFLLFRLRRPVVFFILCGFSLSLSLLSLSNELLRVLRLKLCGVVWGHWEFLGGQKEVREVVGVAELAYCVSGWHNFLSCGVGSLAPLGSNCNGKDVDSKSKLLSFLGCDQKDAVTTACASLNNCRNDVKTATALQEDFRQVRQQQERQDLFVRISFPLL